MPADELASVPEVLATAGGHGFDLPRQYLRTGPHAVAPAHYVASLEARGLLEQDGLVRPSVHDLNPSLPDLGVVAGARVELHEELTCPLNRHLLTSSNRGSWTSPVRPTWWRALPAIRTTRPTTCPTGGPVS